MLGEDHGVHKPNDRPEMVPGARYGAVERSVRGSVASTQSAMCVA